MSEQKNVKSRKRMDCDVFMTEQSILCSDILINGNFYAQKGCRTCNVDAEGSIFCDDDFSGKTLISFSGTVEIGDRARVENIISAHSIRLGNETITETLYAEQIEMGENIQGKNITSAGEIRGLENVKVERIYAGGDINLAEGARCQTIYCGGDLFLKGKLDLEGAEDFYEYDALVRGKVYSDEWFLEGNISYAVLGGFCDFPSDD